MNEFYPPNDELLEKTPLKSRFILINAAAARTKKIMENRILIPINYKLNKPHERALEEIYNDRIKIILEKEDNKENILNLIAEQYIP
ncbi:MAG: DNA-directed RNA polymerase subunit omega [Candidatus Calescibacterium sp.]|nr:DNA-directed RNA polymerase subunit omega [Candidatus Calescibacterium sp.]MCX7972016.1 DNA-directed RNA polymerase subunit omega [bacterium]MDW8194700.1 DNA-directed RNA polymerase subunit omega [Candidatus Calescibacterium sp.]